MFLIKETQEFAGMFFYLFAKLSDVPPPLPLLRITLGSICVTLLKEPRKLTES